MSEEIFDDDVTVTPVEGTDPKQYLLNFVIYEEVGRVTVYGEVIYDKFDNNNSGD